MTVVLDSDRLKIQMKKVLKVIRAVLSNLFKKEEEQNWAKDQILKMARLGGRLVI